jgi:hypothetical protein
MGDWNAVEKAFVPARDFALSLTLPICVAGTAVFCSRIANIWSARATS